MGSRSLQRQPPLKPKPPPPDPSGRHQNLRIARGGGGGIDQKQCHGGTRPKRGDPSASRSQTRSGHKGRDQGAGADTRTHSPPAEVSWLQTPDGGNIVSP